MLKRTCLAAIAALSLSVSEVSALPLGNPLDASWLTQGLCWEGHCHNDFCDPCTNWCDSWSIRAGFYGDYVFNRYLEVDGNYDPDIRNAELWTNAFYAAFNLYDRFDLFITLGQSKFRLDTPGSAFFITGTRNNALVSIESDSSFSWSIGGRATLWECGCFGFGIEAQYFRFRPDLNFFEFAGTDPIYLDHSRMNYREYQVGIGATYTIPITCGWAAFVVPYVGVKWAHARVDFGDYRLDIGGNIYQLENLENRHSCGGVIGITLVGCRKWSFTAEGRYADELALHINSQVRF